MNASALNRSQDITFSVLPKASYYDENNNLLAQKYPVDSLGNSAPSSFFVDMIPALDGVSFTSDVLVTESEFHIPELVTLEDAGNEELLEVKIAQNSFLEVKLAGSSEFIPFETDLTLTREQLSSGGQDALFRKTGNLLVLQTY